MDYTLARYAKRELERLSFDLTKQRLVEHLGYPETILAVPYDADFVTRGLAVDTRFGNILKVDRHGYVGRAYRGRRRLDRAERHERYRNVKVRLHAKRYHWIDTLFALPEVSLFASLVDFFDDVGGGPPYEKMFADVRESIDTCHRDGSLKAILTEDLGRFIIRDPELGDTLERLRRGGKKLFVLTNSEWSYTQKVLAFLLPGGWRQHFQLTLVAGQKPSFFTQDLPFHAITEQDDVAPQPASVLEDGGVYAGGSIRALTRLRPELGGETVLYVGDHIYGDIIRSKKDTLWRTALILEELEDELLLKRQLAEHQVTLELLWSRRDLLEFEVQGLESGRLGSDPKRLENQRRELSEVNAELRRIRDHVDSRYNPYWGSVFREGNELSRFGEQVESYACIYTSRVSNLLHYSPHQYFRRPRHWMPHEKG